MKRFIRTELFLYTVIIAVFTVSFLAVWLRTEKKIDTLLENKPVVIYGVTEEDNKEEGKTVYITANGERYHNDGCDYLNDNMLAVSESDAVRAGFEACAYCQP